MKDLRLFSLNAGRRLAAAVAAQLGLAASEHEERDFTDGEHKIRPLVDVEGADVYLLQSLYSAPPGADGGSVDDKLVRLLFFLGALRDAGAARLTAVIPYLCYARKDRRTQPRDPLSGRYLAALLEAAGCDCVVTLDAHNLAAFENAFRCRTLHLRAQSLFVGFAAAQLAEDPRPPVVVSPDLGGIKRAEAFRLALGRRLGRDLGQAFVEKYRAEDQLTGGALVTAGAGEVRDATVLILDDLIAGGGTIERAVQAVRAAGAGRVLALASHGQFCSGALARLEQLPLDAVAVTDSLPQGAHSLLHILDCAPLLAEAIRRLHGGGASVELSLHE